MEVIHKRVAGLDVHKATVVACVRLMSGRKVEPGMSDLRDHDGGLVALLAWLTECRCTHVAMEATGVYWTPVWKILSEGDFELIVANAAHIKHGSRPQDRHERCDVDRRSAGVRADPGELRAGRGDPGTAFADAHPQADWCASRRGMSSASRRRWQRPTSRLDTVISDIMGVSGRRMIEAMIAGVRNPHRAGGTWPIAASRPRPRNSTMLCTGG